MADPTNESELSEDVPTQTSGFEALINNMAKNIKPGIMDGVIYGIKETEQTIKLGKTIGEAYAVGFKQIMEAPEFIENITKSMIDYGQMTYAESAFKKFKEQLVGASLQSSEYAVQAAEDLQKVSGLSVEALQRTEFGINTVTKRAVEQTINMSRESGEMMVTLLNGMQVKFDDIFNAPSVVKNFRTAVLDDSKIYIAAVEGMSAKMVRTVTEMEERLGSSSKNINELLQIEFSETGKISGQILQEQNKIILAAAETSGVQVAQVRQDMEAMLGNFRTYGMMTMEEMASLSNAMSHLGVSTSEVTTLLGKFSTFDQAVTATNNLAAITGATLDTVKLFELANTDVEEFINELRGELEDAGVEFENLNFVQQKALASTFGIDPRMMQRLLNDNIEAVSSIAEATKSAAEKYTDEEAEKRLLSMDKLRDSQETQKQYYERQAKLSQMNLDTAMSVQKGTSIIAESMTKIYQQSTNGINNLAVASKQATKMALDAADDLHKAWMTYDKYDKILDNAITKTDKMLGIATTPPTVSTPIAAVSPVMTTAPTPQAVPAADASRTTSSSPPSVTKEVESGPRQPPAEQVIRVEVALRDDAGILTAKHISGEPAKTTRGNNVYLTVTETPGRA